MARRRTKKAYEDLYHDGFTLFESVETILFPNGEREIWIRSQDKTKGFRLKASEGPAGISLTVERFTLGPDITGLGFDSDHNAFNAPALKEISLVQYNNDKVSQAFRDWYMTDSEDKENKEALRQRYEVLKGEKV